MPPTPYHIYFDQFRTCGLMLKYYVNYETQKNAMHEMKMIMIEG